MLRRWRRAPNSCSPKAVRLKGRSKNGLACFATSARQRGVETALKERLHDELRAYALQLAQARVPQLTPSLDLNQALFAPDARPTALDDTFFAALRVAAPNLHTLLMRRVFVAEPSLSITELQALAGSP